MIIQVRGNGGLDYGEVVGGGEKWSDSRVVWNDSGFVKFLVMEIS